jgi:5-methyltetrahydrofolate--homocysteine methyltransferase
LGVRGGIAKKLDRSLKDSKIRSEIQQADPKALEILQAVEIVKAKYGKTKILEPKAVYRFFGAESENRKLKLFTSDAPDSECVGILEFPRQKTEMRLCLSDYVSPGLTPQGKRDTIAMFLVSVGNGVREEAEKLKNSGDYLQSHVLQALALETAEAYAEFLHSHIRKIWGFPDPPEMTMMERFQAKYRGKRYSFGYPACPRLDDQALLFQLLNAQEIGVELTEGFMMDPESSVSAIVFHHPKAMYFSVGQGQTSSAFENLDDQR